MKALRGMRLVASLALLVLAVTLLLVPDRSDGAPSRQTLPQASTVAASVTLAATVIDPMRGWAGAWKNPHEGPGFYLSSCYGWRWGAMHRGLDMVRGYGTTIRAAAAGKVMATGWIGSGYGREVYIYHGGGIWTHYAHLKQITVKAGQTVVAFQRVGYEGASGDVTGSHLHFEVETGNRTGHFIYGNQTNPAPFLRARGVKVAC